MTRNRKKIGRAGEDFAAKWLEKNNLEILERNYRKREGEIDIIALDYFDLSEKNHKPGKIAEDTRNSQNCSEYKKDKENHREAQPVEPAGEIVFMEVKTRIIDSGPIEESIDEKKREQIRTMALRYLSENNLNETPVRFDVMFIEWNQKEKKWKARWIKHAF